MERWIRIKTCRRELMSNSIPHFTSLQITDFSFYKLKMLTEEVCQLAAKENSIQSTVKPDRSNFSFFFKKFWPWRWTRWNWTDRYGLVQKVREPSDLCQFQSTEAHLPSRHTLTLKWHQRENTTLKFTVYIFWLILYKLHSKFLHNMTASVWQYSMFTVTLLFSHF